MPHPNFICPPFQSYPAVIEESCLIYNRPSGLAVAQPTTRQPSQIFESAAGQCSESWSLYRNMLDFKSVPCVASVVAIKDDPTLTSIMPKSTRPV